MDTGMIIGSVVALVIMAVPLVIYFRTKDRKGTLNILINGDSVRLLLSDDDYASFDISDIKDDKKRVDEELVKVIESRAKELVNYVDKVEFLKNRDEKFEMELLGLIESYK